MTSEEVRARGVAFGAGGTEPEGRERLCSAYVRFFTKSSHCAEDHPTQKSQVMSLVQILPLHLVQVGWGSLSKEDRNTPHFRPPTSGQILNSLDIIKERKERILKLLFKKVEETPIHHQRKHSSRRRRAGHHGERGLHSTVVEQKMTVELLC